MQLEHLLTDEQKDLRSMIRKFVQNEIMPVRAKIEDDYGLVESIHKKLVELGIQRAGYPAEYGGGNHNSYINGAILCEELARGDAGMSLSVGINGTLLNPAMAAGNKVVLDRFAPAFCGDTLTYACLSMTDSTGGADTENPLLQGRGITTRARLDGDEYVISGTKAWPTHGGIASFYLTICTTDPAAGEEGIALIYVPAGSAGLSCPGTFIVQGGSAASGPPSTALSIMTVLESRKNTGWRGRGMMPIFIMPQPEPLLNGTLPPYPLALPRPLSR